MTNLESIKSEYEKIKTELRQSEASSDWEKLGKLQKKKEFYERIIQGQEKLEKIKKELTDAEKILITEKYPKLISLAQEEKKKLLKEEQNLEREIKKILKTIHGNEEEPNSVIIEIRAGAGGNEAALFAGNLFNMYSKFAESQGWRTKVLNSHSTELGGYKEIIFQISGPGCFSKMKYEGGVHRVQRIPVTEKSGRIHTSTASVAVLAQPSKTQIEINPEDIKIDTFKSSGPGGQNVNKRETAIRITHVPTGIIVASQSERNQLQNRENAMAILRAKLLEKKEQEEVQKLGSKRRTQIGQAKRAEKIRTYNFPQNRVTDHRIKKTWYNLEAIMSGELNGVIKELERTLQYKSGGSRTSAF